MNNDPNIPYIGNGPYCYANSTSMLLCSINEDIPPQIIEILSGVGLGACLLTKDQLLFLNTYAGAPDTGISMALKIFGFKYEEKVNQDPNFNPFGQLKNDLEKSPVVIGPLDMGFLKYNPKSKMLFGVDHYVTVYKIDDQWIYLHDPAGFPCVHLSFENLQNAWKAENISYKRGYYRCWTKPKRTSQPTNQEIFNQAVQFFKTLYLESRAIADNKGLKIDDEAIAILVNRLENGDISSYERGHLTQFALPLGAKRSLDYSSFFAPYDSKMSALKQKQAQLLGKCHSSIMRNDWINASKSMEEFRFTEKKFKISLLGK